MPYVEIRIDGEVQDRFFAPEINAGNQAEFVSVCRRMAGRGVTESAPDAPRCPGCKRDLSADFERQGPMRGCMYCGTPLASAFPHCHKCQLSLPRLREGERFCGDCGSELTLS